MTFDRFMHLTGNALFALLGAIILYAFFTQAP